MRLKYLNTITCQRWNKAEEILHSIVKLEENSYRNTFLFDHDGPHFSLKPNELGNTITEAILSTLAKGKT